MPFSHPFNRPYILDLVNRHRCNMVLDIGIGYGAIGAYLKYYLPHTIIDGIEIYAGYKNHPLACWDLYRKIWIGDFTQMDIPPVYDGVLAIDVIEHLDKAQGKKQILRLATLARKVFIISVPLGEYPQGAYEFTNARSGLLESNVYETHKSTWYEGDFRRLGLKLIAKNNVIGVFAKRRS